MTDELVFYTNPMSRGRIVRWMLEEVGAPYRTDLVGYGPAMKSPEFLAINPMGKVPALRHGNAIVTESAAIIAYLADAFPDAQLAPPPTSPLRAPYYRWLFFCAGPMEAALTDKSLGFEIPADKRSMSGYGSYDTVLTVLETTLGQSDYLVGDRFSAADVYVGSTIGFGLYLKTIEPRPAFRAYWKRLESRPACLRAREIDDALMPTDGPPH